MVLCDFFPMYNLPKDTCSPTVESAESQRSSADEAKNDESVNRPASPYNASEANTVSYALARHIRPSASEFIVLIWILSLISEEIRQVFDNCACGVPQHNRIDFQLITMEAQSMKHAVLIYFQTFWNKVDLFAIFLFFVGFALRFINNSDCFCAARVVLSVDLAIWFMRSLTIFTAVKRLGPKLVMIGEMVCPSSISISDIVKYARTLSFSFKIWKLS